VKCGDHFNQSQAQVTSWPVLREEEREEGREEEEGDSDYKTSIGNTKINRLSEEQSNSYCIWAN
jgi:hypothetical protein